MPPKYLLFIVASCSSAGCALSGHASGFSLSVRRVGGKVNVLLRGSTNVEGWRIDQLRSHANVALTDQNPGMMDGLGQTLLVDVGLETSIQQFLSGQLQNLIEFEFIVSEETIAVHASQKGRTFEDALGVIRSEGQQSSRGLAEFGECVLYAPDFTLAAQSVFSNQLKFRIQAFLFVGTTGCLVG